MKVTAVIPVYNEEKTIANIVKRAQKYCDEVIVVDDCSTDNTASIIQKLGVKYALHGKNKGAGAATRTGLICAKSADIIVTLDSDGQHNPDEIPILLEPFNISGSIGIVIGSRFLNKMARYNPKEIGFYSCYAEEYQYEYTKIPRYRKFGIDIITWLYNIGHKSKITDAQCCFRAYSKAFISKLDIEEEGFGFSTEVLLKARKLDFSIVEVPVSCIYHNNFKQDSTLNPIKHGLSVALKTIWWRVKLRI